MVILGAYTRFGTDELVPLRNDQKGSLADGFARLTGLVAFVLASVCLTFILYNLLGNVNGDNDPTNGWIYAFTMPWAGYGAMTMLAIFVRQWRPEGYPEWLSVAKDLVFGALDVWSKAVFGVWVGMKALGKVDPIFVI